MADEQKTMQEMQAELSELSERREALQKELNAAKKECARETEELIRRKRREISDGFDRELKTADAAIRSITDKRDRARAEGVKARIADRTASLHAENKELKKNIAALFQSEKAPAFARTGLFYAYTMPRGPKEILTALLSFIFIFAVLPGALYALLPNPAAWHWAVIYLLVILIFGGLYVYLNGVKTKHLETVRKGRGLRDRIRANKKQIQKIEKEIRRDKDDALYGLKAFDDQLAQENGKRAETEKRRSEALEQFDAVTKNVLSDEVSAKYEEQITALSNSLSDMTAKTKEREEKIKNYGKTADDQGNI